MLLCLAGLASACYASHGRDRDSNPPDTLGQTCSADPECDDHEPCNGREACDPETWTCRAGIQRRDFSQCRTVDGRIAACVDGLCDLRWEEVCIPAGPFLMGADIDDEGAEGGWGWLPAFPKHVVTLSQYCIDKYEITNRRLRRCIDAGGCRPPIAEARTCHVAPNEPYTYGDPFLDHPAVYVDRELAGQICAFEGKRLPTDAEWEKAGRGGCELAGDPLTCDEADERPYPWGSERPEEALAFYQETDFPVVGSCPAGASPYGVMDMAGSVTEIVLDCDPAIDPHEGPTAGYLACADGCVDPFNALCPPGTWWSILRGGHGGCDTGGSRLGLRVYDRKVDTGGIIHDGARCVRSALAHEEGGEP